MVRSIILLSGIVLTLGVCRIAAAATPHLVYPRPCCPNGCVPNVGTYGYFPTTWRAWPCEESTRNHQPALDRGGTPFHTARPGASAAAAAHAAATATANRAQGRDTADAGSSHSRAPDARGAGDASGRAEGGETILAAAGGRVAGAARRARPIASSRLAEGRTNTAVFGPQSAFPARQRGDETGRRRPQPREAATEGRGQACGTTQAARPAETFVDRQISAGGAI